VDYLGLGGQLYVDEYSSRFGDLPDERITRRREAPPRRNESSNAVMIALAGIVAVGVLLLAAWKLNPSSDQAPPPIPPADTTHTNLPADSNPASLPVVKQQQKEVAQKARQSDLTPKAHPVSLRINIATGQKSWLIIRRLSDPQQVVYQNVLTSPAHVGGRVQKDTKGYLITAACNPTSLTLMVNGKMFTLDSSNGPWKITYKGVVKTRVPAGVPSGGC
jgi:hypothetical protein